MSWNPKKADTILGRQNNIQVLILRNCEYDTLHGKKNFASMIKLKILRWEILLDYFLNKPNAIIRSFIRGRQKRQSQKRRYEDKNR